VRNRPILLGVDEDESSRMHLRTHLNNRYGTDYEVVIESSGQRAVELLGTMAADDRRVAVVLSDQWMPEMTGTEFFRRVRAVYPTSKRVLLLAMGELRSFDELIQQAVGMGDIDCSLPKPTMPRNEAFHRTIAELLDEWSRLDEEPFAFLRVVGEEPSARSQELRDLLHRNGVPFGFSDAATPEGRELLGQIGISGDRLPVVVMFDGKTLVQPSNEEVADALGARPDISGDYDLTIVGAGPSGLAAAVYAASEGLRVLVLEREAVGGQAGTSSRIRNYLGFPRGVSGSELAGRAYQQAWLFGADFQFIREAAVIDRQDGMFVVKTSDGAEIRSRAAVIATGVSYRQLQIPGIDSFLGAGVFYGSAITEAPATRGADVFVVGGGNSAGQAAMHLARYAARVSLVVRGANLAKSMSTYLIKEIEGTTNVDVLLESEVIGCSGSDRLEGVILRGRTLGEAEERAARALFVLIGAQPHTEWLPPGIERDDRGFVYTGADVLTGDWWTDASRPPFPLETSVPGVFAVGDVRHGSVKRVASAVGEGSVVIDQCHRYLAAGADESIPTYSR
jgi:thioredoxin reductase (NADPH)